MAVDPWDYRPSSAAAMIFVILFAVSTLWHITIVFRCRVWYFIPLVVGGCLETAGYIARYLATKDTTNLALFVIQTLCILVAPAIFAASIYMVLGRLIILVHAEEYSLVRPSWLTKIFVGGDILSFLIQVMGSGMISSNFSLAKTIILVGLAAQIVFFGLFVAVSIVLHRRLSRGPTAMSQMLDSRSRKKGWRGVILVIYLVSAMIFIRSIFRFVEFTGSNGSPIMKSEAYIYVCDSTLMFGVLAILIYLHPSEYVPNRKEMIHLQGEELR